ncbi:hypothetical protein Vafri_17621 [Volvox africanus]|uniref:FHA domain-containing protein n=1 Tax=Volvox africanus TaxID=51714 RepID=A0A8J4BL00_9CHLO|nr:hypothetical protein Vafri_17621 [Volvox africanus]
MDSRDSDEDQATVTPAPMPPPPPKFKPPPPKFTSLSVKDLDVTSGTSDVTADGTAKLLDPDDSQVQATAVTSPNSVGISATPIAAAAATAARAAAAAAAGAIPGQRDRVIAQITSAMYAKATAAATAAEGAEATASGGGGSGAVGLSPGPAPSYDPPSWSGVPEGVEYSLEVLKNGSIVETRAVSAQPFYTFGRNPSADFILEHPSASRLHAVLQFNGETREAFIYDPGSTHGTFLNKQRIKPKVYVPLAVGHTLRFGSSSRLYILGGPAELMPPEGLSRDQRRQLATLEASKKMKEKQQQAAHRSMAAALSGGVTWGMSDAGDDDPRNDVDLEDADSIDWRALVATGHQLNDRQQKLAEKIRSKEWKLQNLKTENQRITAKERQEGGLTQGQATTLARNSQAMERLEEELEELEETLRESIRDALMNKKREAEAARAGGSKKRKERADSDGEGAGSDSSDEFFDRTAGGGGGGGASASAAARAAAAKRQKAASGSTGPAVAAVESAESLYGKKELLLEEQQRLQAAVAEEAAVVAAARPPEGRREAVIDSGRKELQSKEAGPDAEGCSVGAIASTAGVGESEVEDSLDAFMANMDTQIEKDKLASLKRQLADVEAQLTRVTKLLRIADPDGWLQPGSAAAGRACAAAAAAAAAAAVPEDRRVKAAIAMAAAAAAKRRKEEEIAKQGFKMEEEEEQEEGSAQAPGPDASATGNGGEAAAQQHLAGGGAGSSVRSAIWSGNSTGASGPPGGAAAGLSGPGVAVGAGSGSGGLLIIRRPPGASVPRGTQVGQKVQQAGHPERHAVSAEAKAAAAALMAEMNAAPSLPALPSGGRGLAKDEEAEAEAAEIRGGGGGGGKVHRTGGGGGSAEAAVAADLEVLAAARRRREELAAAEAAEAAQWRPPEGQRGDGRTSLNDKLGY